MSFKRFLQIAISLTLLLSSPTWAEEKPWYYFSPGDFMSSARPDGHAPIGVMGEHVHKKGGWMTSFRYMHMDMDGMRSGTTSLTPAQVLGMGYTVTPTDMTMDMYMFGVMYAPADFVTLMLMLPLVDKNMNHLTGMGGTFATDAFGIGDLRLVGLFPLMGWKKHRVHLQFGLAFPTGSINEMDTTPMGVQRLPYPMQIGSGTWDLLPGLTYLGQTHRFSWGLQVNGITRLGNNDNFYTFGNRLNVSSWGAYRWCDWLSNSFRVEGQVWGDVDGFDFALNPGVVPTADPFKQGGEAVDVLFGLNFFVPKGRWGVKGQRIAVEGGIPVYQSLNGPQMERDWTLIVGWQWSMH